MTLDDAKADVSRMMASNFVEWVKADRVGNKPERFIRNMTVLTNVNDIIDFITEDELDEIFALLMTLEAGYWLP